MNKNKQHNALIRSLKNEIATKSRVEAQLRISKKKLGKDVMNQLKAEVNK